MQNCNIEKDSGNCWIIGSNSSLPLKVHLCPLLCNVAVPFHCGRRYISLILDLAMWFAFDSGVLVDVMWAEALYVCTCVVWFDHHEVIMFWMATVPSTWAPQWTYTKQKWSESKGMDSREHPFKEMNQDRASILACSQVLLTINLIILLQRSFLCLKTHSYKTSLFQVRYNQLVFHFYSHTLLQVLLFRGWKVNDYISQTSLKLGFWLQDRLFKWDVLVLYLGGRKEMDCMFRWQAKFMRVRHNCIEQSQHSSA